MSDDHHMLAGSKPMKGDEIRLSQDARRAELAMSAPLNGAAVVMTFSTRTVGELDLAEIISVLNTKVAAVQGGDLREAEAILTAQALALNAIFTEMAICAGLNTKHSLDVVDRCLRLALKAQGQCRATLETLAALKNPSAAVFAQQANIAHGPQQVNNGVPARTATTRADACNRQLGQNELLEHQDGHRLDTGAAGAAGASGAAMATLGALDWPAHR